MNSYSIPQGLNTKQRAMYRALMNAEEDNLEKRWNYNPKQILVGRKVTNARNGEVKITFDTEPRISVPVKPLKELEPLEEQMVEKIVTEEVLRKEIAKLDTAIETMKQRRDAWKMLLTDYFHKEV